MDPRIEQAHAACVPHGEPAGIGSSAGRYRRVESRTPLEVSFAGQVHTWAAEGGRLQVRFRAEAPPGNAAPEDTVLITGWNAMAEPCTLIDNLAANEDLTGWIERAGGRVAGTAYTTSPSRSWLEETLIVHALDVEAAEEIATAFGQPAFTTLGPDSMTIHVTGLFAVEHIKEDTGANLVTKHGVPDYQIDSQMHCPMRTDDMPGEPCVLRGGPWTSAAIHAATLWNAHRGLLVPRLGCQPCDGGAGPLLGQFGAKGIRLKNPGHGLALASRYGGYVWT